jgi:hypothetical protein
MLKVKLIAKVGRGGKVKIRFEEGPHPGLEEYVRTANPRNAHSASTSTHNARVKRSRKVHHFPQSKSAPLCRLI